MQRTKKRTLPPPKENLLESLFWPQKKTFQAGGRYSNPIKTKKAISTTEIFLCAPILFGKEKFLTGTGRCMLSFSQLCWSPPWARNRREKNSLVHWSKYLKLERNTDNFGRKFWFWILRAEAGWNPGETRLKYLQEKFAEKSVGYSPKVRQTKI